MLYVKSGLDSVSPEDLARDMARLPQWRREKSMSYKPFHMQVECTASYLLLCEGLVREYGIDFMPVFAIDAHGKPSLPELPDVHFNISHCSLAAACVIDSCPVGVDVEVRGRFKEGLARYCMNASELDSILSHTDSDLAFTKLWTQKEAVCKLLGTGITDNLRDILLPQNTAGMCIKTELYDGFVVSVAKKEE